MYIWKSVYLAMEFPHRSQKHSLPGFLDKGIFLNKLGHPEGTTNKKLVEMVAVLAVVLPFRQDNRTAGQQLLQLRPAFPHFSII